MRSQWLLVMTCLVGATGCRQLLGLDDLPPRDSGSPDVSLVDAYVADAGLCQTLGPECAGPTLRTCSVIGELPTDTPCAWGCSTVGAAHCGKLQPAGGALVPDDVSGTGLMDTTLASGTVINSTDGAISGGVRPPGTGIKNGIDFAVRNGVGILRFKSLAFSPSSAPIILIGDNAIALVASDGMMLTALVDVRGDCGGGIGGPGGGKGTIGDGTGNGGGHGGTCLTNCAGGAGGGHGAVGGNGGMANGPPTPGGGAGFGDATISLLQGGGAGGGGGGASSLGGGGGGGLQLASNGTIQLAGGINAGGCGGDGSNQDAGAGGGAGGTILIEAPSVELIGGIAANGGGGGGGHNGTAGVSGLLAPTPAPGGTGAEGQGGTGGAAGSLAGGIGGANNKHGGGGGGAVGRIRVNTFTGAMQVMGSSFISPGFAEVGTTSTQGIAVVQ